MKLASPLDVVDSNKRRDGDHEILILALVGGNNLASGCYDSEVRKSLT